MNNRNIKTCLYHAWTNVSSEYVSDYNKGYYAEHKNDWRVRKAKRQSERIQGGHNYFNQELNKPASSRTNSSNFLSSESIQEAANSLSKQYRSNSKWNFEKGGEFLYDVVSVGKSVIEAGKKAINSIINWRKEVHEKRQDTTNTIGALIKSGINWLKNYFS